MPFIAGKDTYTIHDFYANYLQTIRKLKIEKQKQNRIFSFIFSIGSINFLQVNVYWFVPNLSTKIAKIEKEKVCVLLLRFFFNTNCVRLK
jgi:hypothetical protein